jgi:hypothetical protein
LYVVVNSKDVGVAPEVAKVSMENNPFLLTHPP